MKLTCITAAASLVGMAFLAAVPAAEGGTQTGTITTLYVRDGDGLIYVYMTGTASGRPVCATGSYWMVRAENSEAGKRHFAALLAAKLAGQTVQIVGKNTCLRWVDGEDIEEVAVL